MKKMMVISLILLVAFGITHNWKATAEDQITINMEYLVKNGEANYMVPTTKLTLDALPFTVKIPTYDPFNVGPYEFKTSGINYFEEVGRIESALRLVNKGNPKEHIDVFFGNYPDDTFNPEKVSNINKETDGYYERQENYSTLYFVDDQSIYYRIDYYSKETPHEVKVMELERIFNSLTDYNEVLDYQF